MLLPGLTEANSFQNKTVHVSAAENNSGGWSDLEVNLLLSSAKKPLIFLIPNSVRFRISHPGSGPVDITFILHWDGKCPCALCRLKGRLSFLPLDQKFLAVIARQVERQSRTQALLGGCQGFREGRIGPGLKGDFFVGQHCQRVYSAHSTRSR